MTVALSLVEPTSWQNGQTLVLVAFNGGFGATPPGGTVLTFFNNLALETHTVTSFTSWSDNIVTCVAPTFTNAGTISVSFTAGITSNTISTTNFTSSFFISSITPNPVISGNNLTITGTGFGATQGTHSVAFGTGLSLPVVSWSSTSIVVSTDNLFGFGGFPPTGLLQVVQILSNVDAVLSNLCVFVEGTPVVNSTLPANLTLGPSQTFEVIAAGFGFTQDGTTITFNTAGGVGVPVTPTFWLTNQEEEQEIVLVTPSGADIGVDSIVFSNGGYTVTIPILIQSPLDLPGGTVAVRSQPVVITGSGFGASAGSLTYISANGSPIQSSPTGSPFLVTDWSNTTIKTNVPATADLGAGYFYVFPSGSSREDGIFSGFTVGTQAAGPATALFEVGTTVTSLRTDGTYPIPPNSVFPRGVIQDITLGVSEADVAWLNPDGATYTEVEAPYSDLIALGGLMSNAQNRIGAFPPVVIEGDG